MTSASIFGIALAPLFAAIAEVESENGKTSDNVYQLSDAYIKDANRISEDVVFTSPIMYSASREEQIMCIYLFYYGKRYLHMTGETPTAEVLARIHNGGPNGWRKPSTLKYWHKVKAAMERRKPCPTP